MQKSNWKKCKLGDVATTTTTKISCSDITSNYISTENMLPDKGGIVAASLLPNSGNVSIYHKGDVLVSNIRPYFKKIWHATVDGAASNDVIVFHANEGVNSRYLYYTLADDNFFAYVMTGAKGTKMPRGDRKQILQYPVNLPSLDEQKRIAEILGSLDDKIELLQKQNKTLEDMAKALFKSWFVDFDVVRAKQKGLPKADIVREYHLTEELYDLFPSSFADSPLGPIPSGWEVKTIQDLGEVVCGKTPSTSHKEYYGGSMPFITIPDMHNSIFVNKTERYLTSQGEQAQPTKTLPPFSVCVSCIATPGLVTMTTANSQTNQQINSVIPHNLEAKFYNYYVLRSVADQIRAQGSGGSVFVNLNKTAFSKIKVLWADQSLQKLFTKESESYFNKILNNLKQIQTLTELRDTLLPRLISGKIRV